MGDLPSPNREHCVGGAHPPNREHWLEVIVAAEANNEAKKKSKAPPRSPEEIQADIHATRARLVDTIEDLKAETRPKVLLGRAQQSAKDFFVDPATGEVHAPRVAAVVGGVVVAAMLMKGMRSHRRRRELKRLAQVVWVPVPRQAVSGQFARSARNAKELAPLTSDYEPRLAIEVA